jgi:acetyl-CoA synthetase
MTCSGGDSAQGADEAHRLGLELPALAPATCERLREILPTAATVANPLDYTALLWGDGPTLTRLVQTIGEDPAIDQVLVFYDQFPGLTGAMSDASDAVRHGIIAGAAVSPAATMICSTLPELLDDDAAWECAESGIPAIAGLRTGLACLAAMRTAPGDPARLREIARAAIDRSDSPTQWLSEHDAKELLRAGGVEVVDGRLVADAEEAVLALAEFGPPIALKLSSGAIQHKSELGAVWLGLATETAVAEAFARLQTLATHFGGAVLAERMAAPGTELIVAARADAVVPAVIVGLGGVWTEVLDDVAIVPLPADAARIERGIRGLRGAPLLTGARGSAPVDLSAVARLAQRVGDLLLAESLDLLELNPVLAGPSGAVAVDATARRRVAVRAAALEAAA